jgi:hypothetical protein
MPRPPAAFLSYVRFEDQHDEGRITELRNRLEGPLRPRFAPGSALRDCEDRQAEPSHRVE